MSIRSGGNIMKTLGEYSQRVSARKWLALIASLALALGMVIAGLLLVKSQARAEPQAGTISGTITYSGGITGSYNLIVAAHLDYTQPPEESDTVLSPGGDFAIGSLPDGDYYLSLFLDVTGGGGPSETWEPEMFYDPDGDAQPNTITVAGGDVTGIHLDLGGPWLSLDGPRAPGGQVSDIAANLTTAEMLFAAVSSPNTFDRGTTEIYKTVDGGQSWESLITIDKPVHALAAAGDMVYAGAFNPDGEGVGIYRSPDGGDTWDEVYTFPRRGVWIDMSVDPLDPDHAVAGGRLDDGTGNDHGIVYGTVDGGLTWSPLLTATLPGESSSVDAVLIHPVTPTIILAAYQDYNTGDSIIYRSDDGGATWGDSFSVLNGKVVSLAANPAEPDLLLAGVGNDPFWWTPDEDHRVLRSQDAGLTWDDVFTEGGSHVRFMPPDQAVALDFGNVWVSESNGDPGTWQWVGNAYEQFSFEVDAGANPIGLYMGGWVSGVWKSEDGGAGWFDSNNGITALVATTDVVVDPSDGQKLFVGSRGGFGWMSDDGGQSWMMPDGVSVWMSTFAVNPQDSNIVYGGAYECSRAAVLRSEDGGLSFTPVYTGTGIVPDCSTGADQQIYALAIAPSLPDIVYAGGWFRDDVGQEHAGVLRTLNDGGAWEEVYNQENHKIEAIAINPQDENNVFIGGDDCSAGPCEGVIYLSTDGGDTWDLSLTVTDTVSSIVIDPQKPEVVYMADHGYWVRKSMDSGQTWEVIKPPWWVPPGNPSGYLLAIDPVVPSHLYLGGFGYIAESTDGGETWSNWGWNINRASPIREPTALTVFNDGAHERLYAGYDGAWAFDRASPTPGLAATIDMWTDPASGPIYANGENGVIYKGLVLDEKLNWVENGTPVTVTYDLSQLTGEVFNIQKSTLNGLVSGGELGVSQAGTVTFTAQTASGATGVATMEFIINPADGITVTAGAPSLMAGGESTIITATVAGLHGGIASDGTLVTFETSLGSIDASALTSAGVATATLTSGSGWGAAIVTASVGEFSDQAQVEIVPIRVMLPLIIQ
jgi:hypothetical protein